MLSIGKLVGGQAHYYAGLAAEDYYLKGGEPLGVWFGNGAHKLGLVGAVERGALSNLCRGSSPDGKTSLVQLQRRSGKRSHAPGWDLTFSAPKDVSILWSQADPLTRNQIQLAHWEAVQEALRYIQDTCGWTRRGKGGARRERADLVIPCFGHGTSRATAGNAPDPQLHHHCLVMNITVAEDGRTRTLADSGLLYRHKMAAGALYRAELSYQLEKRLGVVTERDGYAFKVRGVPDTLAEQFSKRRQVIKAALAQQGNYDAKTAAQVTLKTRMTKEHRPRAELFEEWQQVGRAYGFSTDQVKDLQREHLARPEPSERLALAISRALERLTETESHFSERDLVRSIAEEAQGEFLSAREIRSTVMNELERSSEIVRLGVQHGEERFTTKDMLDIERRLFEQVDALAADKSHVLSEKAIERALAKLPTINAEQADAVRHITCRQGAIQIESGLAGTGKTYLLRAPRIAWEEKGFTVIGAALSGQAAKGLEKDSGIKSYTVAKLLGLPEVGYKGDLEKGLVDDAKHHVRQLLRAALGKSTWQPDRVKLDKNTVLVVDEVSMIGTRQLEKLVSLVAKAGAKLVLIGDDKQLQSIEAGGAFRALRERLGAAELKEITRQRESWARDAIKSIIRGDAYEALAMYAERGLLKVAKTRHDAMESLIQDWRKEGAKRPEDHLILASSNAEVKAINEMAHKERKLEKQLGTIHIKVGDEYLHENDRVLFTRNSKSIGVKNGSLGTIMRIDVFERQLFVHLDDGAVAMVPLNEYEDLRRGYAITTHRAQGATVEHAYVLAGGAMQDRELSYVQLSRSRGNTRIFTDELTAGKDLRDLAEQMSRSRQKELAHDVIAQQMQHRLDL